MKAQKDQLIKIHIARKQLGLTDDDYRSAIQSYGVEHANELSWNDAEDILEKFKRLGWKESATSKTKNSKPAQNKIQRFGFGKKKYENLRGRGKQYPKPQKLRMIEALWRDVSREKTDESLANFIYKKTGVDDITFLLEDQARIILTALQAMAKNKEEQS